LTIDKPWIENGSDCRIENRPSKIDHALLFYCAMPPNLTHKVAIVTGSSRGIGFAIATALAARGADVVMCGRTSDAVQAAKERMVERLGRTAGAPAAGRIEAVAADVRSPQQAARLVDIATARFGGLDMLINNAGVGGDTAVAEQSVDEWRQIMETNLNGPFYCARAAIPALRRRGGGWIINISSLAGTHPFARAAAYCASKAGLNAFSEALMQEVRYEGIRVATVAPGSVETEFMGEAGPGADWKLTPDDVAQVVLDLLAHDKRSLPSLVELRPSRPRK
jgi:NAD(P)-dependent dehydrogenase (short-subunit alcohol dehydrogenase family)